MTLRTRADVRDMIQKHLPATTREKSTWRHVLEQLDKAAHGADPIDVAVALRLVLSMEGVECRPAP
jgi:hypothetical protein